MSITTVIIALLSILVGYISQAVNTGSFLGVVTIPKPWLPFLTLFGTFLSAGVASIAQTATVNAQAWFTALVAGLAALTGTTVGVTVHQHLTATPTDGNAVKVAAKLTANGNLDAAKKVISGAALILVVGLFAGTTTGCAGTTPSPQVIVADVVTGEQAVCIILNATLTVPAIQQACNLANALIPVIQQIVDSELKARASGCKHAITYERGRSVVIHWIKPESGALPNAA